MFPQRRTEKIEVTQHMQQELAKLKQLGYGAMGGDLVFSLLERRIQAKPIRALFVQAMAGYAQAHSTRHPLRQVQQKAKRKLLHVQLPFIAEVIISVQYLHNQILDAKSGVEGQLSISQNLLAANLLKSHLQSYLQSEVHPALRQITNERVQKAFEQVDLGQTIEKRYNNYTVWRQADRMEALVLPPSLASAIRLESAQLFIEKIKKDVPRTYWEYLDVYFQRIYLTCAALFVQLTELIIELADVKYEAAAAMRDFASSYGLMRQLVNDNADLVPAAYGLQTHAKINTDAGSDLRNGTITLPLLFHLCASNLGKGEVRDYLSGERPEWNQERASVFFNEIMNTHSLPKSIQNTRALAELAVQYLDTQHPDAQWLAESCDIAHWNKFLRPCLQHKAYRAYRNTRYSQRTRQFIRALRAPTSLCTITRETWKTSGSVSLADARTNIRAYNPTA